MKWLRNILKGASLTTALFIFQACYGSPPDWASDNVTVKVVRASDGEPIGDISIKVREAGSATGEWALRAYTLDDGQATLYISHNSDLGTEFLFEDEKGVYEPKDTVVTRLDGVVRVALKQAE